MPTKQSKAKKKEFIILVDPKDNKIGTCEKILTHQHAMLHRAFSVFVYRRKNRQIQILLQRRNVNKYHAGGLWTNTCCGHPHLGEKIKNSAQKRLGEEMGISVNLKEIGVFHYVAVFDNGLYENELDHVFIGQYDDEEIPYDPDEVDTYKWISVADLKKDLSKNNNQYTPWFEQAFKLALSRI